MDKLNPGTCKVLVVDDECLIRAAIVALLEEAGFQVLDAENSDNAYLILADHPDIAVLLWNTFPLRERMTLNALATGRLALQYSFPAP